MKPGIKSQIIEAQRAAAAQNFPPALTGDQRKFCAYLASDACQSPFGDWFEFRNELQEQMEPGGSSYTTDFEFRDVGENAHAVPGEWFECDLLKIAETIRKIDADPAAVDIHHSHVAGFRGFNRAPEDCEYDAVSADAVLQVIAFGKVIYG